MYHRADGKSRKEPERPCRQGRTADVNTRRQRERAVYQLCKFLHQVFEPLQRRQLHSRRQTRSKIHIRHIYRKQERIKIMANITYRQVNDYMIPNLKLPPEETSIRLSKWGMLYKDYLQKHNPVLFTTLLTQGKLYQYCAQIDTQAQQMFTTLVEQMIKTESITEQLKSQNQLEWVHRMNSIQERASEIVCNELIYV